MRLRPLGVISATTVCLVVGANGLKSPQRAPDQTLVTGKKISSDLSGIEVGSFPISMTKSPDGKFIVVTNVGYREQLSVLDAQSGRLISRREFAKKSRTEKGLYFGLAFGTVNGKTILYASQGAQDVVGLYELSAQGELSPLGAIEDPAPESYGYKHNVAGLALSGDAKTLYAVNNQSTAKNGFASSISVLDTESKVLKREIAVPGFPYDVVAITTGPKAGHVFVSCERDGFVVDIDPSGDKVRQIKVGAGPTNLLLDKAQSRLFVSNSASDTLSVIDTASDKVTDTVLLRPTEFRNLPGATPLGLTLSHDEKSLFVALADMNAVGVVNLGGSNRGPKLTGFLPTGWYPTSVILSSNGASLFVANAKGTKALNPNNVSVGSLGQYGPNIIEGNVTSVPVSDALDHLAASTETVLAQNFANDQAVKDNAREFVRPNVHHVIYVIRENRTYDQVLGDFKGGNGDPKLCLFPEEVTPNLHALAKRFALLDNFYVCAEVSQDGWVWSTAGLANDYVQRNTFYNYSGRGRSYDTEGQNNNSPVDLKGVRDITTPPNGYIWDQASRQNRTYRNYGFFVSEDKESKEASNLTGTEFDAPTKKALVGHTCTDFREFDMSFADSDAWTQYHLRPAPNQRATFGSHKDTSRMATFHREFDEFVKNGNFPALSLLRLPHDHTIGTSSGHSSPRACVADNDYAIGQLVDLVSHSPYWKDTVICVLEDDAQAGFDHVDCHRSPALVISPFISPNTVASQFYNTDSMLRTIELLIGLKPLSQYDAIAKPIQVFGKVASNLPPYSAILPPKEIIGETNNILSYRAKDSARLISLDHEESEVDNVLNDILWGAIKGANVPRPKTLGTKWGTD